MNARFAKATIWITALFWIGFAVWLGLSPAALLIAFGIEQSTPAMLTEIRAFYGGVEFAIAFAMIILLQRHEYQSSLLVGGLPLIGSSTFRMIGQALDGFSLTHSVFAGFELTGALFCLAGWYSLRKPAPSAS